MMNSNKLPSRAIAVAIVLMVASELAMAGTGGTYVSSLETFIAQALQGTVGMVIGLSGLLYGLIAGVAKGNLGGMGVGVGLAAGAYYGPDIIIGMTTAVHMSF